MQFLLYAPCIVRQAGSQSKMYYAFGQSSLIRDDFGGKMSAKEVALIPFEMTTCKIEKLAIYCNLLQLDCSLLLPTDKQFHLF